MSFAFKCQALFSFFVILGDDRNRTDNPLLAKQVLSQLSYVPFLRRMIANFFNAGTWIRTMDLVVISDAL